MGVDYFFTARFFITERIRARIMCSFARFPSYAFSRRVGEAVFSVGHETRRSGTASKKRALQIKFLNDKHFRDADRSSHARFEI